MAPRVRGRSPRARRVAHPAALMDAEHEAPRAAAPARAGRTNVAAVEGRHPLVLWLIPARRAAAAAEVSTWRPLADGGAGRARHPRSSMAPAGRPSHSTSSRQGSGHLPRGAELFAPGERVSSRQGLIEGHPGRRRVRPGRRPDDGYLHRQRGGGCIPDLPPRSGKAADPLPDSQAPDRQPGAKAKGGAHGTRTRSADRILRPCAQWREFLFIGCH
jgi:hypothetical protein